MGIISFGEKIGDWHSGAWVIRAILRYAGEKIGGVACSEDLLETLQNNFNRISMEEMLPNVAIKLTEVIGTYCDDGLFRELVKDESYKEEFVEAFRDLGAKCSQYLRSARRI